jgi:hypothetical protein
VARDYLWDAEAERGIKSKKLHEHHEKYKDRYENLAAATFKQVCEAHGVKELVTEADLFLVLRPLLAIDKELLKILTQRSISDSRQPRYIAWFAWYAVIQIWSERFPKSGQ